MPCSLTRVLNIVHLKVVFCLHCFYMLDEVDTAISHNERTFSDLCPRNRSTAAVQRNNWAMYTLCYLSLCVCVFNMIHLIWGTRMIYVRPHSDSYL